MAKVVLKGTEHNMRMDFNAICAFEKATGKSFIRFSNDLLEHGALSMEMSDMRALIWAGLLNENKTLKLEDAGNMIDLTEMDGIAQAITAAISEAFPTLDETDKKKTES